MKLKLTILCLFLMLYGKISFPQVDSVNFYRWVPAAVAGLNISQIAFSNWSQGGDNSLTWTLLGSGGLRYQNPVWTFRNNLKLAYGRTKLGDQDYRTNDNELYLESVVSKNIGWAIDPYFSNTIRSAVASGFSYDSIPPYEIAAFFDPGYITQSLGFTYERSEAFNTRIGVAIQEVITNRHTQYSDDVETGEIEKFKLETGIEAVTNAVYTLAENLLTKSSLRLFSRFESFDVWDVRWDNIVSAKVNDFLDVNLTFLVVYEKQQSVKTQIKQTLQLGFTYTLL